MKTANFAAWPAENVKAWVVDCIRYRGRVLVGEHAHYCNDWDGLVIDESCFEWPCGCPEGDET